MKLRKFAYTLLAGTLIAQCAAVNAYADSDLTATLNDSFISYEAVEAAEILETEYETELPEDDEYEEETEISEESAEDAADSADEDESVNRADASVTDEAAIENENDIPADEEADEPDDTAALQEVSDPDQTAEAVLTSEDELADTETSYEDDEEADAFPAYPEEEILLPEETQYTEAESLDIPETEILDLPEAEMLDTAPASMAADADKAAVDVTDVTDDPADIAVTETEIPADPAEESVLLDASYYSYPSAPTSFTVTAQEDSAVLKWTKAYNATGYRIEMYDCKTKQSSWLVATQKKKYTATGLKLGQSYKFRLLAYKQYGTEIVFGQYSKWVKIKTVKIDPKRPKKLEAKEKDAAVRLTWTAGKSCSKYQIEILDPKTNKIRKAGRTAATSFTVTGLVNNKQYKFRVTGYAKVKGKVRYSPSTKWITAAPNALGDATASGWNKSIYLNWPKVSGASKFVIFKYNTKNGKLTKLKTVKATRTEYKVKDLKNGKSYSFVIKVYKNGKVHSTSQVLTASPFVPRKAYIKTAKEYEGALKGSDKHKEIIDIYNSQKPLPVSYKVTYYDDWCAAFATAMAVKAKVTRMIPGECSCTRQIALWKARGQYVSGNKYVPSPGDLIYYDWNPELKDGPEHVGIVIAVKKNNITTIEGNTGTPSSVGIRYRTVGYKYIYGYGVPNGK